MDHSKPAASPAPSSPRQVVPPSRQTIAMDRLGKSLGFKPEIMGDEWTEAVADACADSAVAKAITDAYRKRDVIGWSRR